MTSIVGVLRKAAEGRHLRLPRLRRLRRGVLVGVGLGLGVGALGLGAGLLAPEVLAAPAATGGPAIPAVGATSSNITFFRQAGADRYATAAAIAADTFGNSAPTVLLTTGTNYPDALAAAYLAGTESGGAPILLTKPTSLDPATSAALVSLHASKVVIIGGTGAVSMAVQTALAANYQVSRIAGANRYDTAKLVDTQPGEQVGTDAAGQPSAVLVSGATYADALSASALGYARHLPVVLTDPAVLSPQAVDVLSADHIAHVVQVGGSGAIAPSVTQAVRSMGISVDEVAGTDRSATSNLLAADEVANYGFSLEHFDLASGTDFPDSLAGGPHAGGEAAPMLLSTGASSPGSAPAWAAAHCSSLTSGDIFGGTGALGASTAQLVGLACPSNGSISLMTGIGPVVQGSLTASTGSTAAGSSTASTGHLVPGPSGGSTTALTASVAICGPPGSLIACRPGDGQTVLFTAFPSRSGACGTLNPTKATTNGPGVQFGEGEAQTTYTSPSINGTVIGTCIITATANGYSASASLALPPPPVIYPPCPCCGPVPLGPPIPCCGPIVAGGPASPSVGCCGPPASPSVACCGPIVAGGPTSSSATSPAIASCCGSPPCTTQVCPYGVSPPVQSSGLAEPGVIIACPLGTGQANRLGSISPNT